MITQKKDGVKLRPSFFFTKMYLKEVLFYLESLIWYKKKTRIVMLRYRLSSGKRLKDSKVFAETEVLAR